MAEKHLIEQKLHTKNYLIPYFRSQFPEFDQMNILEVGCAEGGFVEALNDESIHISGIELVEGRVKIANETNPELDITVGDITDTKLVDRFAEKFDLVVIRDVIEHVPDKEAAFQNLNKLLKPNGFLYITFPPRFSAFAGHQQTGKSILRVVPFLHFLPRFILRFLGNRFNERKSTIEHILENYDIGISVRRFINLFKANEFIPVVKGYFLLRPIFKTRFGSKIWRFPNVLFFREFALGCEYLLKKKSD